MSDHRKIDLNCDLGEMPESAQRDIEILSIVSSCNIACGGHAGDDISMALMVRHAIANGVRIGAHPSYPDRENFGRQSLDIHHNILRQSLTDQIQALIKITDAHGASLSYVKPHGALYNDAADNSDLAKLIVDTIYDINPQLAVMGLPHSSVQNMADDAGIEFIAEAFIDRKYMATARLQPRQEDGAVITDKQSQEVQALALAKGKKLLSADGTPILIRADSLCMHSDSDDALSNAAHIAKMLSQNGIMLTAS